MITFEELLARDGKFVYRTRGVSMEPMLRQNRDLVTIEVPVSRLQKYDVALYKRDTSYVLHRVIDVKEGYYLIRGDNTYGIERVPEENVIGVLTRFQRKGKQHTVSEPGYRRYARFWNAIYPLRYGLVCCYRWAARVARRLGLTPYLKRLLKRS